MWAPFLVNRAEPTSSGCDQDADAAVYWTYDYNKLNLLEREFVVVDGLTRTIDPSYDALGIQDVS